MKKTLFSTLILLAAAVFTPAAVSAATNVQTAQTCQPVYGGAQTCQPGQNVVLNKTVQNPQNGQFVDNLTVNDPRYLPTNSIAFHITVTNTGNTAVSQITVKDVMPEHVTFVSGPGNFDANTRTLTYTIANLEAGKSQTAVIFGQAADMSELTQDVTCVTNQAVMTIGSENAQDNAALCIDRHPTVTTTPNNPAATPGTTNTPNKTTTGTTGTTSATPTNTEGGIPTTNGSTATTLPGTTKGGQQIYSAPLVEKTPKTGSEDLLTLLALIPTGSLGYILRKKALLLK